MYSKNFLNDTVLKYLPFESINIVKTEVFRATKYAPCKIILHFKNGTMRNIVLPLDFCSPFRFSYDNEKAFVGNWAKPGLTCHSVETGEKLWENKKVNHIVDMAVHNNKLYCRHYEKGVLIFSADTGENVGQIKKTEFIPFFAGVLLIIPQQKIFVKAFLNFCQAKVKMSPFDD